MRFLEKGGKVIWKPMPDELAALITEAIAAGIIGSNRTTTSSQWLASSAARTSATIASFTTS